MNKLDALFTRIAQEKLETDTLETRRSDSLDFYDVSVWEVRNALQAAYDAGLAARAAQKQKPLAAKARRPTSAKAPRR